MINISIRENPEMYFDYRKGLRFLADLICDVDTRTAKEVTYFHLYTEVRTPKEELAIKSYLATQDLVRTKLIVWSDYDISDQENIQDYTPFVEFKVYNPKELAKGTVLEGMDSHLEPGGDHNHWMSSGVMRFLVLYVYGGIYFDMDMVLLRDFTPILGQDFAYQWGGSTDFAKERRHEEDCHGPCAALVGCRKGSEFIHECLAQVARTELTGGTCLDEDLLSYVYRIVPFTVFPSTFFNTEWLMSKVDQPLSVEVEESWFSKELKDLDNLFLDAFSWHWHNSSNKSKDFVKGSKFDLLNKRMDRLIYWRLDI